jgi:hypothetical protein
MNTFATVYREKLSKAQQLRHNNYYFIIETILYYTLYLLQDKLKTIAINETILRQ